VIWALPRAATPTLETQISLRFRDRTSCARNDGC